MSRACVALAALLSFCTRAERPVADAPISVVLISIDTLRSDRLPAYGYRKVQTPHIDALRADGVLYERVYSHAPLTLPAHASMLTGLLPTEHGVRNNIGYPFDGSKLTTLAEELRTRGYRTGGAVSSYVLRAGTGINDGFDWYDDEIAVAAGTSGGEQQRAGSVTLERSRRWLAQVGHQPFFLFFHIYEPHAPYAAPEPFRGRFADAYDAEIAAADAVVGGLIQTLKSAGQYENSLIVLTSDHGESLWEHGEDQHGILLYREALQVPLIVKLPRSQRAGNVISETFPLKAVHDLILDTVGARSREAGPPTQSAVYSETLYPRIHLGWSELRSLIRDNYHYIDSSSPELYDLVRDPRETTNLLTTERRLAASMRRELETMPAPTISLSPINREDAAKLAALGYIGSPQQRSGPLPNPRERIHDLAAIRHAFRLASDRRYDEAIVELRKLAAANPRQLDVITRLGEVLADSGRHEEAIAVYRSAISMSERASADLLLGAATAYFKANKPKDAAAHAETALEANPLDGHELLARISLSEGKLQDADRHVRAALDAGKKQPRTILLAAEVQRAAGRLEEALQTIATAEDRATQLGSAPPLGLDHLRGDLLARLDRPRDAIIAYQREIDRYPNHLQAYANLALIHLIEGRRDEADAILQRMIRENPHRAARVLAEKTLQVWRG